MKTSKTLSILLLLLLVSCGLFAGGAGQPSMTQAKVALGQVKTIVDGLVLRLEAIDIDKDGFLSMPEATVALTAAWLEWEAAEKKRG